MSRPVVSAEDVRAAARAGQAQLAVPPDAIITPLARDEASRRGIELVEATIARPAATPPAGRHSATCDPDDLERIIERVRVRVPEAEPAQVRDIARRLLERLGG